jgi:hypothetical protein
MAESTSVFNTPVLWINEYLKEKIGLDTGIGVPFFPSRPASIDELTESWIIITPESTIEPQRLAYAGVMATWDRLVRMRRSPFPHIKQEQLLYYFYATESDVTEKMVQVQEKVLRLMDREDETAEEINKWAKAKGQIDGMDCKFFFHKFKVYQLEEVRDIIDFGTARTYGGNKIIIDFEYHQVSNKYEESEGSTADRPRYNKDTITDAGILP